jgi:hypothetical protein
VLVSENFQKLGLRAYKSTMASTGSLREGTTLPQAYHLFSWSGKKCAGAPTHILIIEVSTLILLQYITALDLPSHTHIFLMVNSLHSAMPTLLLEASSPALPACLLF